jgi:hypothetical protein
MFIPIFLICMSCALLALLGGLFLLVYAKKEACGKGVKIPAYVAIVFGALVFVGGFIAPMFSQACHHGKCNHKQMMHNEAMMGHHGPCNEGMACPMQKMNDHCSASNRCEGHAKCEKSSCAETSSAHQMPQKACCKKDSTANKQ